MNEQSITDAKIAELASYLPEQVHSPSRAEIEAWQQTEEYAQARRTNKVRQAMNSLCTRKPTTVVIGEPDTTDWEPDMLRLYTACKAAGRTFTLKDGHARTMYLADEDALNRELQQHRPYEIIVVQPTVQQAHSLSDTRIAPRDNSEIPGGDS